MSSIFLNSCLQAELPDPERCGFDYLRIVDISCQSDSLYQVTIDFELGQTFDNVVYIYATANNEFASQLHEIVELTKFPYTIRNLSIRNRAREYIEVRFKEHYECNAGQFYDEPDC